MRALYASLMTLPVSSRKIQPHKLHWPFGPRPMIAHWKASRFTEGKFSVDPEKSPQWNRGAYLANTLGHCNECHTLRDYLGAHRGDRYLAGTCTGPDGRLVPSVV